MYKSVRTYTVCSLARSIFVGHLTLFLVDGEFGGGIGRPFEEGQVHGTMDHHERRRVSSSRVVPRRGLFILASLSHTHCCFLSSH